MLTLGILSRSLLTGHAAAHDEGVVYGGHGVEILGGAERGQRAVAGGGQPDGGAVLPVLPQHHAPVRVLKHFNK